MDHIRVHRVGAGLVDREEDPEEDREEDPEEDHEEGFSDRGDAFVLVSRVNKLITRT